jgi:hypothetical protein
MRLYDAGLEVWRFHRRPLLVCAALVVGLVALLFGLATVVRATGPAHSNAMERSSTSAPTASSLPHTSAPAPTAAASDVGDWNAIPPITPATSTAYRAINDPARMDPSAFASAFASELFTRNYRTDRAQLISWAQFEDAPLHSTNYPAADWSKVLVDSLTDLTWDNATDTAIPGDGPWLALRAEHATDSVSNVRVTVDQQWEQQIAGGYQPSDQLATVRDLSLTVVRHALVSGRDVAQRFSVSFAVQLGSSPRGGYGVAATNNYLCVGD